MTSRTFFPTRWPTSTFGPGLHNLEIHAEQSSSARGWSASRAAICLQSLYSRLWARNVDVQSWFHYDGNVYHMGRGVPLPCFMSEVEAKYKDITVMATKGDIWRNVDTTVYYSQRREELVPGSLNRGSMTQVAWALRWHFARCKRQRVECIA